MRKGDALRSKEEVLAQYFLQFTSFSMARTSKGVPNLQQIRFLRFGGDLEEGSSTQLAKPSKTIVLKMNSNDFDDFHNLFRYLFWHGFLMSLGK